MVPGAHLNRYKNPLHFSFPPEVDEEALMSGAEQLSEAVLESGRYSYLPS